MLHLSFGTLLFLEVERIIYHRGIQVVSGSATRLKNICIINMLVSIVNKCRRSLRVLRWMYICSRTPAMISHLASNDA